MERDRALAAYKAGERSHRRGKRRHSKPSISLAIVAGFAPAVMHLVDAYRIGGIEAVPQHLSMIATGWDPADGRWKPAMAVQYLWGPLLLGGLLHKAANRIGLNRQMRKLTMGILSI